MHLRKTENHKLHPEQDTGVGGGGGGEMENLSSNLDEYFTHIYLQHTGFKLRASLENQKSLC